MSMKYGLLYDEEGNVIQEPFIKGGTRHVRQPWDREQMAIEYFEEGRTIQSARDEVDIHRIIEKYDRTGVLPMPKRKGYYGDVSHLNKYYGEVIEDSIAAIEKAGKFIVEEEAKLKAAQEEQAKIKKEIEAKASSTTDQPKSSDES
jgi:hypothetical protein